MNKKSGEKNGWFYLAVGCILVSLFSLFLPIFQSYGINFDIIDLLSGNSYFAHNVIGAYTGPVIWNITSDTVVILSIISVAALVCAIIGLITLRAQYPNTWNFILTIVGLIGILIPSVTAIVCVVGLGQYYPGGLSLGIAPIISPIAIIVSIGAVVRRKNRVAEKLQKKAEEKGLIWQAGDL